MTTDNPTRHPIWLLRRPRQEDVGIGYCSSTQATEQVELASRSEQFRQETWESDYLNRYLLMNAMFATRDWNKTGELRIHYYSK
jgi:hypothetical protein